MRALERRRDQVGGVEVFSLAAGPGETRSTQPAAPDLVLIHGLGVSHRYLWPSIELLATDFRVFAPDLPGVGRSDRPKRRLSMEELADGVAEWMDEVGARRATVVGHSLGCTLAAVLAERHPTRVVALVLACPAPDPEQRPLLRQAWRLLIDAPRERLRMVLTAASDYVRVGPTWVLRALTEARRGDPAADLGRVLQPALVVRGERDPLVSPRWAQQLVDALPRSELVTVADAPHGLPCSTPEAFVAALRPFLALHAT